MDKDENTIYYIILWFLLQLVGSVPLRPHSSEITFGDMVLLV